MKYLHMVSFILLVVGGLNWLAVGLLDTNVVEWLLGTGTITMVIYILVGLGAIYEVATHKGRCKECGSGGMM